MDSTNDTQQLYKYKSFIILIGFGNMGFLILINVLLIVKVSQFLYYNINEANWDCLRNSRTKTEAIHEEPPLKTLAHLPS